MGDAIWSDVVDNLGRLSEIVNTVYTEQRRRRDSIWVICPIFTGNSCPNPLCDHITAHVGSALPDYADLPIMNGVRSGWYVLGDHDRMGRLNLQTPAHVAAAATLCGGWQTLQRHPDQEVPPSVREVPCGGSSSQRHSRRNGRD